MQCLIERLNSLCEFLDNSFDVNCGGCCLISSFIAEHLDNLNIKYNLIIFDNDDKDVDSIIHEVQNNEYSNDNNSVVGYNTSSHYCIEINDELINCSEKYSEGNYYKFRIPNVTYSDILWIYDEGCWNDNYDTDYSETIENIINNFFSIYENKIDKIYDKR